MEDELSVQPDLAESEESQPSDVEQPDIPESSDSNTDIQLEIHEYESIIIYLRHKLKKVTKEKNEEMKKMSRDLLETLSTSHEIIMQSQRMKYEEMIREVNNTNDTKIASITDYYEEKMYLIQKKHAEIVEEKTLLNEKIKSLNQSLFVSKEKLENIHCALLGTSPTSQVQHPNGEIEDDPFIKKESDCINETIRKHERQINDQKKLMEDLKKDIQSKETEVSNMMFQVNYYKDVKEQEEAERKRLYAENIDLLKQFDIMQDRYKEQFNHYEKLLQKSRQEIDVHKREINRLRDLCGNFPPSPAARKLTRKSNSAPDVRAIPAPAVKLLQMTPQSVSQESVISTLSSKSSVSKNKNNTNSTTSSATTTETYKTDVDSAGPSKEFLETRNQSMSSPEETKKKRRGRPRKKRSTKK